MGGSAAAPEANAVQRLPRAGGAEGRAAWLARGHEGLKQRTPEQLHGQGTTLMSSMSSSQAPSMGMARRTTSLPTYRSILPAPLSTWPLTESAVHAVLADLPSARSDVGRPKKHEQTLLCLPTVPMRVCAELMQPRVCPSACRPPSFANRFCMQNRAASTKDRLLHACCGPGAAFQ